jgi:serine/threonine protein kinase
MFEPPPDIVHKLEAEQTKGKRMPRGVSDEYRRAFPEWKQMQDKEKQEKEKKREKLMTRRYTRAITPNVMKHFHGKKEEKKQPPTVEQQYPKTSPFYVPPLPPRPLREPYNVPSIWNTKNAPSLPDGRNAFLQKADLSANFNNMTESEIRESKSRQIRKAYHSNRQQSLGAVVPALKKSTVEAVIKSHHSLNNLYRNLKPSTPMKMEDLEVITHLGEGSTSKVFLSRHSSSRELFTLKVLSNIDLKSEGGDLLVKQLKAEIDCLSAISHSFVVKLHDVLHDASDTVLVLDYVPGGDLSRHVKRMGVFPEEWARFYCAEILLAMEHLHSEGICIRDIKLENIILDVQGHIVLTDFGMSCPNFDGISTELMGTPEYMAPEMVRGGPYGYAVDFWGLGCALYEMIMGCLPFDGENLADLCRAILNREPKLGANRNISVSALDLIAKLLCKDPLKRLDSSAVRFHPFFDHVDWNAMQRKEIPPPCKPRVYEPQDYAQLQTSLTVAASKSSINKVGQESVAQVGNTNNGSDDSSSTSAPVSVSTSASGDGENGNSEAVTNSSNSNDPKHADPASICTNTKDTNPPSEEEIQSSAEEKRYQHKEDVVPRPLEDNEAMWPYSTESLKAIAVTPPPVEWNTDVRAATIPPLSSGVKFRAADGGRMTESREAKVFDEYVRRHTENASEKKFKEQQAAYASFYPHRMGVGNKAHKALSKSKKTAVDHFPRGEEDLATILGMEKEIPELAPSSHTSERQQAHNDGNDSIRSHDKDKKKKKVKGPPRPPMSDNYNVLLKPVKDNPVFLTPGIMDEASAFVRDAASLGYSITSDGKMQVDPEKNAAVKLKVKEVKDHAADELTDTLKFHGKFK